MSKGKNKISGEEDVVYDFLSKENRPFSVQNIVDALQKAGVKKTAVERSLATLVEKGKVAKKEYGKAKIFILAQDQLDLPDPEEVTRLDAEVKTLTTELAQITDRVADHQAELDELTKEPTLEEATARDAELDEELAVKEKKREALGDGSKLTTKEDKRILEVKYYNTKALWKKYKRMVTDIIDAIGEATGKKNSELHDDMCIETDEAAGVKFSEFPDIPNPKKSSRIATPTRAIKRQRQQ